MAINTVLGNFKTALSGSYLQYRFNRRYNLRSIFTATHSCRRLHGQAVDASALGLLSIIANQVQI